MGYLREQNSLPAGNDSVGAIFDQRYILPAHE
jgi:hypothetical protein